MKIAATDEYGLRVLLRIAKSGEHGMSIAQLSESEGLSEPYVGKLARMLRIAGFISSRRGKRGGYVLARDPSTITVNSVLKQLDGQLFDDSFCSNHAGTKAFCTNSIDCSIRSLWSIVQDKIDNLLDEITIAHLMGSEKEVSSMLVQS